MTRPLRSTPITGASPLLRVGPPAEPATVLTPTQSAGYSLSPTRETRTGSVGFGLLPFHAEAADRARVASMPDTAWPISGHPPDLSRDHLDTPVSMSPESFSTRQQRFACARLPDPHLTHELRRFHIAHHGRVTAPAACGGLKPPPQGDSEGPTILHLLHSTASRSSTYIELPSTLGTHPEMTTSGISGIIARLSDLAGIDRIYAHRLRHTAAMDVLAAGGTLTEARELLGHAFTVTTMTYAKVDLASLRELVVPFGQVPR